jgi:YggT family protein
MSTIFRSLEILFNFVEILIIVRVFMSIFRISLDNSIGKIIYELTEPILLPARMLLNKLGLDRGMIDFSPWIAILLLRIIYSVIMRILM